jgi:hypothetical protein
MGPEGCLIGSLSVLSGKTAFPSRSLRCVIIRPRTLTQARGYGGYKA